MAKKHLTLLKIGQLGFFFFFWVIRSILFLRIKIIIHFNPDYGYGYGYD